MANSSQHTGIEPTQTTTSECTLGEEDLFMLKRGEIKEIPIDPIKAREEELLAHIANLEHEIERLRVALSQELQKNIRIPDIGIRPPFEGGRIEDPGAGMIRTGDGYDHPFPCKWVDSTDDSVTITTTTESDSNASIIIHAQADPRIPDNIFDAKFPDPPALDAEKASESLNKLMFAMKNSGPDGYSKL